MTKKSFNLRNVAMTACLAVVCGLIFTGCSSSGSDESGKKLASNEVFGDLPNAVYQYDLVTSSIRADEKAEMDKLDGGKKEDWEKGAKIKDKYKAKRAEADKKFEADVEKIKSQLVGKEIPFEMAEELGYKVKSFKIINLNSQVEATLELEITDATVAKWSGKDLIIQWYEIDKDGNEMSSGKAAYIKFAEKSEGATEKYIMTFSVDEKYVNFAKVKFTKL